MTNELSPGQEKAIIETKEVLASKQDVLMAIGQLQAFSNMRKYVTVTEILTFKKIKDSKQYKGLVYENDKGEPVTVTDLKEVCSVFFGRSYEAMTQDLKNLEAFGAEFLESSQSMGLGYRELRKLRQLPEEEQALVINAESVDISDKAAIVDLIEDLTAKHAKEKEALEAKALEAERTANARQKIINTNNSLYEEASQKYDDLKASLAHKPTSWVKTVREINIASSGLATQAVEIVNQLHDLGDRIVQEEVDSEHSEQALEMMAQVHVYVIDQLFMAVNGLSIEARDRFAGYVNTARVMYSEAEIEALEAEIEARG